MFRIFSIPHERIKLPLLPFVEDAAILQRLLNFNVNRFVRKKLPSWAIVIVWHPLMILGASKFNRLPSSAVDAVAATVTPM
jgi:hypothetical protein